jgi:hypothetical protein
MKKRFYLSGLFLYLLLAGVQRLSAAIIIMTSDQQLEDLQDPDKVIDMSLGLVKQTGSLRQTCEEARRQGDRTLVVVFDEFFRQYRTHAGTERKLTPDMDLYIQKIKKIGDFAKGYNIRLCLSLLSPLELGPAFIKSGGEAGRWIHYTVAPRDPGTGQFTAQLNRQIYWTNNKGNFPIKLTGVRAFAFKEKLMDSGRYSVVKPEEIHEIRDHVRWREWSDPNPSGQEAVRFRRIQIDCSGDDLWKDCDRVFVFLEYESPEMDYFSPQVLPFLKNLLTKYADQKIDLASLYSDEMHIQQDWFYFEHHDNGQFCLRYLTENMAARYAQLYGPEFRDMDKYMLYFVYGAKSYSNQATAVLNTQYVMGESAEDVHKTILFRDRYYKLLSNHVVDLFKEAKTYAEKLFGHELPTQAHASWAESPTIDLCYAGNQPMMANLYEYTANFIWSNTVHQAAAACYDYWKWGEYLQPTGNDFCECGWLDRDYYGAAMAVSIGVVNKYPNAYAAYWGMPLAAQIRKQAVNGAFGGCASETISAITQNAHRDVDVLILYPMNLVAAEERFGSWMTQYAYANYLTAEKLLEMGQVDSRGRLHVADRTYTTLVSLFELLPPDGLLPMMEKMARSGGRVLWCGPPPLLNQNAKSCLEQWQNLFSVDYVSNIYMGEIAAGKQVVFSNAWQELPAQTILTDFLVDRIYPVENRPDANEVARVDGRLVGVHKKLGNGTVTFCGFRPRDDQSASLGYECKTLFQILHAIGAYPATGIFPEQNDNTEFVSRNSDCLTTRFPNGATVIVAHYRTHRENWPGGFSRDDSVDQRILKTNPLPSDTLLLHNMAVNGHRITFNGSLVCAFNLDDKNRWRSFEGHNCMGVEIDGKEVQFAGQPVQSIAWMPANGSAAKTVMQIKCHAASAVSIPWPYEKPAGKMYLQQQGKRTTIPYSLVNGQLQWRMTPALQDQWLYVTMK